MGLTRQFPKPFVPETYRGAGFDVLLAWEPSQFDELLPMAAENDLPYHVQLGKWGDKKTGFWFPEESAKVRGKARLSSY